MHVPTVASIEKAGRRYGYRVVTSVLKVNATRFIVLGLVFILLLERNLYYLHPNNNET